MVTPTGVRAASATASGCLVMLIAIQPEIHPRRRRSRSQIQRVFRNRAVWDSQNTAWLVAALLVGRLKLARVEAWAVLLIQTKARSPGRVSSQGLGLALSQP